MRQIFPRLSGAAAGGLVLAALLALAWPGPAVAQSDQWNSLFDRIIRLEARVRAMDGAGGGGNTGGGGQNLGAVEAQLRSLVGQVQTLTRDVRRLQSEVDRLRRRSGQQGQAVPPRQNQTFSAAPLPSNSGSGGTETVIEVDRTPGSPQVLGRLRVDGNGNALPGNAAPEKVETATLGSPGSDDGVSADDPSGLYKGSYNHLLGRRFGLAEAGFKLFISQHRSHKLAGSAHFWLGETYFSQGRYRQAAQTFLNGFRGYGKSKIAPDLLLRLGMSLNRLGQKKQACQTLKQVRRKYGKRAKIRSTAQQEIQRAGC